MNKLGRELLAENVRGGPETPTCQSLGRCVVKSNLDRVALERAVWVADPMRAEAIAAPGQLSLTVRASPPGRSGCERLRVRA